MSALTEPFFMKSAKTMIWPGRCSLSGETKVRSSSTSQSSFSIE